MMNLALAVLILANSKVISLAEAVQTAAEHQPTMRQAHANSDVARARVGEARAPLLPQISGLASYGRATGNSATGSIGSCTSLAAGTTMPMRAAGPTWDTCDRFNFTITASQTLWDASGQLARWRQNSVFAESVE